MKLKDITQPGFYYNEKEGRQILFEAYTNQDYVENFDCLSEQEQQELCEDKIRPYSQLLVDMWHYDYEDDEGIKHWTTEGLIFTPHDFEDVNVVKDTLTYKIPQSKINAGCFLVEDKLTYKERLDKIQKLCDKASTKSTFCNGVENKDMQKLAIKILNIILK